MSARTKARKRALDILYSADLRERPLAEPSSRRRSAPLSSRSARPRGCTPARSSTASTSTATVDELITTYANGWTLDRMPAIDRALMRIGVWEILYNDEVPDGVAIAEAVELATELTTDDSAGFVNGVLSAIARDR